MLTEMPFAYLRFITVSVVYSVLQRVEYVMNALFFLENFIPIYCNIISSITHMRHPLKGEPSMRDLFEIQTLFTL